MGGWITMSARAIGLVVLLLLPAALAYAAGYDQFAHYCVLGTVLAYHVGVQARQIAPFGLLVPFVYAAAAITANFTDGVAALLIAVAAATGAASSLGYHRALLAVLAAALIGSCEPATAGVAGNRALSLLAGCLYGLALAQTLGRGFATRALAVHSQTALSYSILLPVLVLVGWFIARAMQIDDVWWLPLAVAVLGEPWLAGTPRRAVLELALSLAATLIALTLLEPITEPALRAASAVVLLLGLVLAAGRDRAWLQAFLFTPVLMLLASDEKNYSSAHYLQATLLAFVVVALCTLLGKWVLWTLRPDAGRAVV